MQRFFCPSQSISSGVIQISDPQQIKHIKQVLRFRTGDKIHIFDGTGWEYQGTINSMDKNNLAVKIMKKEFKKKHPVSISVAVAIPKNVKMDDIVEKLTELGVDTIMPMLTRRTIVKLDEKAKLEKVERWRKIAISSSEQSQRAYVPEIGAIKSFRDVLKDSRDYDLRLVPTLFGKRKKLKDAAGDGRRNILVLIGPEGDFTQDEVNSAIDSGFIPVDLGDTVLRVDTACLYIASILKYVCA